MITAIIFACLVVGSFGQWDDNEPEWGEEETFGIQNNDQKFPPLPGSYPILVATTQATPATDPPTTASAETTVVPVTTVAPVTTTLAPATCTGMFSCKNCNTAQVCRPSATGFVEVKELPCPVTTPFCNALSGTCSTVPDSTCGRTDTFICSGNGYFPDPTNCTIYHACNNYQAQKFRCATGQNYDPRKTECRTGAPCNFNINCQDSSGNKLKMGNSHFFTYCSNNVPLMVSRCPGEYKLNATSQVCEPICEEDGLMADLKNCTKYYKCTTLYINTNLSVPLRQNLPCPAGEAFQPSSYQCIPKNKTTCKL